MGGSDAVVEITGDQGKVEMLFTGTNNGPVGTKEESDIVFNANPNYTRPKFLYLTSGNGYGYLTVHNVDYFESVSFYFAKVPVPFEEGQEERVHIAEKFLE